MYEMLSNLSNGPIVFLRITLFTLVVQSRDKLIQFSKCRRTDKFQKSIEVKGRMGQVTKKINRL